MRKLQLLTVALLIVTARADFATTTTAVALTEASYSCTNSAGGASMGMAGDAFTVGGGNGDGGCVKSFVSGSVPVSSTPDFVEQTDPSASMLDWQGLSWPLGVFLGLGGGIGDGTLDIVGADLLIPDTGAASYDLEGAVHWTGSFSGCVGWVDLAPINYWSCAAAESDVLTWYPPSSLPDRSQYVDHFFTATGEGSGTVSAHVVQDSGLYRIAYMSYGLVADSPVTGEVPEPSTLLLLAGAVAIGIILRYPTTAWSWLVPERARRK